MSNINDLDIPESANNMGTAVINADATYTYTDVSGNVTHGTISNATEEIGGTSIQCLDFSVNESGANDFLTRRAYYDESRPYELHFGNSNIARLVREEYVEPTDTSWKALYRKELINLMDQGSVFDEPMWDLQDIDGDGIPELLISSGETQNDYLYISYYDNGDLRTVANAYAVSQLGEYGVMGLCREEHLLGWKKSFDSCGFNVRIHPNIQQLIWDKMFTNVSLSAVTALLSVEMGYIAANEHAWYLAERLVREAAAVARGMGLRADDEKLLAKVRATSEGSPNGVTSICADIRAGRKTEVDTISGSVVRAAKKCGVPAPTHEFVVEMIHALEGRPKS